MVSSGSGILPEYRGVTGTPLPSGKYWPYMGLSGEREDGRKGSPPMAVRIGLGEGATPPVGVKTGGSRVGGPDLCVKADGNKK